IRRRRREERLCSSGTCTWGSARRFTGRSWWEKERRSWRLVFFRGTFRHDRLSRLRHLMWDRELPCVSGRRGRKQGTGNRECERVFHSLFPIEAPVEDEAFDETSRMLRKVLHPLRGVDHRRHLVVGITDHIRHSLFVVCVPFLPTANVSSRHL